VNFGVAAIIRHAPGYQHVPLARLAVLLCARPRLTWAACLIWLINPEWLGINKDKYVTRSKRTLTKAAVSVAISELIMQMFASYSMVKAVIVGTQRGFYLVHHLWPFWRGKDARMLYLGALFWTIAALAIILFWVFFLAFATTIFHYWDMVRRGARKIVKKTPLKIFVRSDTTLGSVSEVASDTPIAPDIHDDDVFRANNNPSPDPMAQRPHGVVSDPMRGGGRSPLSDSTGPTSSTDIENLPMAPDRSGPSPMDSTDIEDLPMRPNRGTPGPVTGSSLSGVDDLPMQPHTSSGAGYNPEPQSDITNPISSYTAVASSRGVLEGAGNNEKEVVRPVGPAVTPTPTVTLTPAATPTPGMDPTVVPPTPTQEHVPGRGGSKEQSQFRDTFTQPGHSWERSKPKIVAVAFTIGMVCWIFQWFFWAGLVNTWGPRYLHSTVFNSTKLANTSGHRFCPPDIGKIAALWVVSTILGNGTWSSSNCVILTRQ
jgi:hypothetical protein